MQPLWFKHSGLELGCSEKRDRLFSSKVLGIGASVAISVKEVYHRECMSDALAKGICYRYPLFYETVVPVAQGHGLGGAMPHFLWLRANTFLINDSLVCGTMAFAMVAQ